jgi:hypothetical protein
MNSLTERIALLESMLKDKGSQPPPANHPPKTNRSWVRQADDSTMEQDRTVPDIPENSSPGSQPEDLTDGDNTDHGNNRQQSDDPEECSPSTMLAPPKKDGLVSRLLSTRGHLSFDQLSGRLRYFGPTTNCHIYSELIQPVDHTRESLEQTRRTEKAIRQLSIETHDYLMDLFWQNYNSVLHVVHEEAFHEDKENGRSQFYSGFLHTCILAMGYRFADKSRPDMLRIALPERESTLHREAKYMLDCELERPGGIPSIAALLLLGDLECGVGRDNLGWLYAGMANRLCFDVGLHLDNRNSGLPKREVQIRHMTLWACVVYDKYWALFLGRPTSLKSSDLEIYNLAKQFERLGTCKPAGSQKSLETQIYEALLDLMELAGKITENIDPSSIANDNIDRNAYLRMAGLDRELNSWYARLPEPLKWSPANINTAPFSYFLLHQQYHSALILLHRPFALYEEPNNSQDPEEGGDNGGSVEKDHFSAMSRTVCTKHAVHVARIFWHHRQRFDTKKIFVTGLQHAVCAHSVVLFASIIQWLTMSVTGHCSDRLGGSFSIHQRLQRS